MLYLKPKPLKKVIKRDTKTRLNLLPYVIIRKIEIFKKRTLAIRFIIYAQSSVSFHKAKKK